MGFKDNILILSSYVIWCAVGFAFAVSFMVVTTEMTYSNEFLDEQKKEWMECGEAIGIIEGSSGEYFDNEAVFETCMDVIEPIICEECEKV